MLYLKIGLIVLLLSLLGVQTYRVKSLQGDITALKLEYESKAKDVLEKRSSVARINNSDDFLNGMLEDDEW